MPNARLVVVQCAMSWGGSAHVVWLGWCGVGWCLWCAGSVCALGGWCGRFGCGVCGGGGGGRDVTVILWTGAQGADSCWKGK